MVEDELIPALHYFDIRFYAYNPVRSITKLLCPVYIIQNCAISICNVHDSIVPLIIPVAI